MFPKILHKRHSFYKFCEGKFKKFYILILLFKVSSVSTYFISAGIKFQITGPKYWIESFQGCFNLRVIDGITTATLSSHTSANSIAGNAQ